MTVRIGIVGSGFAASLHARALRQVPDVEVVAAASPDAEHVYVFTRAFEIPHALIDYRDMVEGDLVDAVIVACPNDLHSAVAVAAAGAGKHVLVDSPMALSLAQCDRMIDVCRNKGVILMYGENLCFAPNYARAKDLADEGALGRIYYVRNVECHQGPQAEWSWDIERSGGGALVDLGSRSIAVCRWLFGNAAVERVSAQLGRFVHRERTEAEDHAVVAMRFATGGHAVGGLGVVESSWARAGGLDSRAEICGSRGTTVADLARGPALQVYSEEGYGFDAGPGRATRGWTWTPSEDVWSSGHLQQMAHFVECVRDGRRPALTGEDGRAVLETVCAAYESARTGQEVPLPFQTDVRRPVDLWLRE